MKKIILLICLFIFAGCEKEDSFRDTERIIPQKSKFWLNCEIVADSSNLKHVTKIIRCENKEVVCYWERDSMGCTFELGG